MHALLLTYCWSKYWLTVHSSDFFHNSMNNMQYQGSTYSNFNCFFYSSFYNVHIIHSTRNVFFEYCSFLSLIYCCSWIGVTCVTVLSCFLYLILCKVFYSILLIYFLISLFLCWGVSCPVWIFVFYFSSYSA